MSISPLKSMCNSDKGSACCSPMVHTISISSSRFISFNRTLSKSTSFQQKTFGKAIKSVRFSDSNCINEVESHSLYSEIERQNTWYHRKELMTIQKNVRSQVMLLRTMPYLSNQKNSTYKDLLDDLISLKFSGIQNQSSQERKYIIGNLLRRQEEQIRKSLKKRKVKPDELSSLYSSLVVNHRDIARKNAIKAAVFVEKNYIEDGLLTTALDMDNKDNLTSGQTKKHNRKSHHNRRLFCLKKKSLAQ